MQFSCFSFPALPALFFCSSLGVGVTCAGWERFYWWIRAAEDRSTVTQLLSWLCVIRVVFTCVLRPLVGSTKRIILDFYRFKRTAFVSIPPSKEELFSLFLNPAESIFRLPLSDCFICPPFSFCSATDFLPSDQVKRTVSASAAQNMASFQIHDDQENRTRDYASAKQFPQPQQKRAVLGTLGNIPERIPLKSQKQPLGINKGNIIKKSDVEKLFRKNDENVFKQAASKQPAPVVPVAQFQAFTVYEDAQDELVRMGIEFLEKKHAEEVFKNAYKGNEERLMTKQEALDKAGAIEVEKPQVIDSFLESPMSVEKLVDENSELHQLCKGSRDLFFQLDEYRDEIFEYLCKQEKVHRPKANYMRKQPDITHNMRTILVDWLVEVAEEYKLYTETLYLAVSYIDRFLSFMSVVRAKLQLVGTAAMFIAAKYEEIYPPDVGEFVYITDDTYSKKQVIRMEMLILKVLDFDISVPTAYTFITAMSIANKLTEKVTFLAQFLSELALLEAEPTLEIMPSMMAAAAIAVARHTVGDDAWSSELEENTGYSLESLQRAAEFLVGMHKKAPGLSQQAIQDKYKVGKYLHVSTIAARDEPIKFD